MSSLKSFFENIPAQSTARALQLALVPILGSAPELVAGDGYYRLVLNQGQEDIASEWILSQLRKEPGPVRLELGNVALKVIARQYWPWILAVLVLGIGAGVVMAKKPRRGRLRYA